MEVRGTGPWSCAAVARESLARPCGWWRWSPADSLPPATSTTLKTPFSITYEHCRDPDLPSDLDFPAIPAERSLRTSSRSGKWMDGHRPYGVRSRGERLTVGATCC